MHGLLIERRSLDGKTLSWQLATHIAARGSQGKVAIVAGKPMALLAATRKQWFGLIRLMERELLSTLNSDRKEQIEMSLAWMRQLKFSAKPPQDVLDADITFATAEDFVCTPPDCQVVYVTYNFEREQLHMLTSWMPPHGRVVIYEQSE